jgi:transposase
MRGSEAEQAGIKARRILAQRMSDEGMNVATIARVFGVPRETVYSDLRAVSEGKVEQAARTLEKALDEDPSPAAPYLKDLLRLVNRIPGSSD